MRDSSHYVQFFDGDSDFALAASRYIREGIEAGCTCVVAVTARHREQIDAQLQACGLNPTALIAEYRYIPLDAQATLATFMSDGRLDRQRFHNDMGLLMRQAGARGQPVCAFGELVSLLVEDGLAATAIQLEELWNELSRHYNFSLFCAYARHALPADDTNRLYRQICAVHSHVVTAA